MRNSTEIKYKLNDLLNKLQQFFMRYASSEDELIEQRLYEVREWQQRLQSDIFRIAVIGEFNRGKSSFINALLNKRILPVDVTPATKIMTKIMFGNEENIYLKYFNGDIKKIKIEELEDFLIKAEKASVKSEIKEIIIEYPLMFCCSGIELIDTPGINNNVEMTSITFSHLSDIDMAIVTISATNPFSKTEAELIVKILETPNITSVLFIITKLDCIEEEQQQRLVEYIKRAIITKTKELVRKKYRADNAIYKKCERIFSEKNMFAISSKLALQSAESFDMNLYEKSGFKELLPHILFDKNERMLCRVVENIENLVFVMQQYTQTLEQKISEVTTFKRTVGTVLYSQLEKEKTIWESFVKQQDCLSSELPSLLQDSFSKIMQEARKKEDVFFICEALKWFADMIVWVNQQYFTQEILYIFENIFYGYKTRMREQVQKKFSSFQGQEITTILYERLETVLQKKMNFSMEKMFLPQLPPLVYSNDYFETWVQSLWGNLEQELALAQERKKFYISRQMEELYNETFLSLQEMIMSLFQEDSLDVRAIKKQQELFSQMLEQTVFQEIEQELQFIKKEIKQ